MMTAMLVAIMVSLGLSSNWQSLPSFYLQSQIYVGHDKVWIVQHARLTLSMHYRASLLA